MFSIRESPRVSFIASLSSIAQSGRVVDRNGSFL
jgi:hypothetical protein